MRNLYLFFLVFVGLVFTGATLASDDGPHISIKQVNVANQTDHTIVIHPRSWTCQNFKTGGITVPSDANQNLGAAVGYAADAGQDIANAMITIVPWAHHGTYSPQACSATYFVYANTQGGQVLIGFLVLNFGVENWLETNSNGSCTPFNTNYYQNNKSESQLATGINANNTQSCSDTGGQITFTGGI